MRFMHNILYRGVLGGTAIAVGGAVQGVAQIFRGAAATPGAIMEPQRGKWWNGKFRLYVSLYVCICFSFYLHYSKSHVVL